MTIEEKKTYVESLVGKEVEYVVQDTRLKDIVKSFRLCSSMDTYLLEFETNTHSVNCTIVREIPKEVV